jgi:hypothetical protein
MHTLPVVLCSWISDENLYEFLMLPCQETSWYEQAIARAGLQSQRKKQTNQPTTRFYFNNGTD